MMNKISLFVGTVAAMGIVTAVYAEGSVLESSGNAGGGYFLHVVPGVSSGDPHLDVTNTLPKVSGGETNELPRVDGGPVDVTNTLPKAGGDDTNELPRVGAILDATNTLPKATGGETNALPKAKTPQTAGNTNGGNVPLDNLCMSKSGILVNCAMAERFDMANAGYSAGLSDAMAGRASAPDSASAPKAYLRGYQIGLGIVKAGNTATHITK